MQRRKKLTVKQLKFKEKYIHILQYKRKNKKVNS